MVYWIDRLLLWLICRLKGHDWHHEGPDVDAQERIICLRDSPFDRLYCEAEGGDSEWERIEELPRA